jgi:hypothetical protein
MTTGAELSALDVLERGFDWYARVWEHAMAGSVWNLLQSLLMALSLGAAAFLVLGAHVVVSLALAASILQFWIGAAIMPLAIPFFFVPGLQGIGGQAFAFMIAATIRLIFLGVIIGAVREVFLDLALPDFQTTATITDVFAAGLASIVAGYLAWVSSTWASVLTRGSVGSTSVTSILASLRSWGPARAGPAWHKPGRPVLALRQLVQHLRPPGSLGARVAAAHALAARASWGASRDHEVPEAGNDRLRQGRDQALAHQAPVACRSRRVPCRDLGRVHFDHWNLGALRGSVCRGARLAQSAFPNVPAYWTLDWISGHGLGGFASQNRRQGPARNAARMNVETYDDNAA